VYNGFLLNEENRIKNENISGIRIEEMLLEMIGSELNLEMIQPLEKLKKDSLIFQSKHNY
jgi:hypothetical protein